MRRKKIKQSRFTELNHNFSAFKTKTENRVALLDVYTRVMFEKHMIQIEGLNRIVKLMEKKFLEEKDGNEE